jgi:hypothetical protein
VRQLVTDLGQMLRSLACRGDASDSDTWRFDAALFERALAGYNAAMDLDEPVTELEALEGVQTLLAYLVLRWAAAVVNGDDFRPVEGFAGDIRDHHLAHLQFHDSFLRSVTSRIDALRSAAGMRME